MHTGHACMYRCSGSAPTWARTFTHAVSDAMANWPTPSKGPLDSGTTLAHMQWEYEKTAQCNACVMPPYDQRKACMHAWAVGLTTTRAHRRQQLASDASGLSSLSSQEAALLASINASIGGPLLHTTRSPCTAYATRCVGVPAPAAPPFLSCCPACCGSRPPRRDPPPWPIWAQANAWALWKGDKRLRH